MTRVAAALIAALMMIVCESAAAYTIHGAGNMSCGQWIASKDRGLPEKINRYDAESWVMGYITAYDFHVFKGENVASGIDAPGLLAWIDNYCTAHPLDKVFDATFMLVFELQRRSGNSP